jgi:two-component system, NtrC family, C4-dicarboxylate transport sensor histidine kinase DctB
MAVRVPFKQYYPLAGAVIAIGVSVLVSQYVWWENGLKSLSVVNEPRVQLVANALNAEVGRQDHLPVVLSLDQEVREALAEPGDRLPRERLNRKLARVSLEADTRALYLIGTDGVVFASDDWQSPTTLVGRDLADRPYFIDAMTFGRSTFLGVEPESKRVRYYLAEAVRNNGVISGIAVARIEFDALEAAWERAAEHVFVTDSDGVVFLASDPRYKYRLMDLVARPESSRSNVGLRYPGVLAPRIEFEMLERRPPDSIIMIKSPEADIAYLYQSMLVPAYGWTIHRLTDLSSVREDRRDGAIIGGASAALVISLLLYVIQRHRAAERLKGEVTERTRELRESNSSLQTEIDEHRRTESRLRTTQNELVQASKLAALGQMSAAIAHEINQPLAAIRTFMASAKIFAQRENFGQVVHNLDLISGLAERMASITGHLKTFARKSDHGQREPVRVEGAVQGTLLLLESQIAAAGVRLDLDIAPDLCVTGNTVQLEQVILNLMRNALDAVAGRPAPWIRIAARASEDTVSIVVSDNGPGIAPELVNRIFDPFFTTKGVGDGLGLGLSISYGIVQGFGGRISARNRPEGGAELTVELPRHHNASVRSEDAIFA